MIDDTAHVTTVDEEAVYAEIRQTIAWLRQMGREASARELEDYIREQTDASTT